jgi:hypothetical protein
MKTTFIQLRWDDNTGEGTIKKVPYFDSLHVVTKLDFLQDCIVDLTDLYNSLLAKEKTND